MLAFVRQAAAAAISALTILATAGLGPAAAQTSRPPAAVLIAAAKQVPLAKFQVSEEIRSLTVEPWLRRLFGEKTAIAWRAASCRAAADGRAMVASPVCVEAAIRFRHGVVFTLGVGFDEKSAKPQDNPDAMWGTITIRGKHCDFLRHPDDIRGAPETIEAIIKAGGRCQ